MGSVMGSAKRNKIPSKSRIFPTFPGLCLSSLMGGSVLSLILSLCPGIFHVSCENWQGQSCIQSSAGTGQSRRIPHSSSSSSYFQAQMVYLLDSSLRGTDMSAKPGFDLLLLILHHPERSEPDSQAAFASLAATKALFFHCCEGIW